jgi:hypothetical protein
LIKLKLLMFCGGRIFYFESTENDNNYTLKSMLSRNKGALSELLSKHIVMNELPAKLLTFIESESETEKLISSSTSDSAHSASTTQLSADGFALLKDEVHKEFYGLYYY